MSCYFMVTISIHYKHKPTHVFISNLRVLQERTVVNWNERVASVTTSIAITLTFLAHVHSRKKLSWDWFSSQHPLQEHVWEWITGMSVCGMRVNAALKIPKPWLKKHSLSKCPIECIPCWISLFLVLLRSISVFRHGQKCRNFHFSSQHERLLYRYILLVLVSINANFMQYVGKHIFMLFSTYKRWEVIK